MSTVSDATVPATTRAAAATAGSESASPPTTVLARPPLTVLAIGDSFVKWSTWPELYAAAVEAELGRPTELDTSLAAGGAGPRLPVIRDDENAHDRIRAADIVVVQPEPGFVGAPMNQYLAGVCGGDSNTDCFAPAADDYRGYVTEYLDLIVSLASDDAEIRVITTGTWGIDGFHPRLRAEDPAKLHDLIDLVDQFMAVVTSEANSRGIAVIDVNTAFTGSDHRQLAPDGYLVADGLHLDDAGSEVVAQLLVETGFGQLGSTAP